MLPLDDKTLTAVRTWLFRELEGIRPLPVPAEDLVGEVLVRLLLSEESHEIRSPFAYARRILQNLIRDHIRSLERARRGLEELGRRHPPEGEEARGDASFEDDELVLFLLENSGLSPIQKKVIQMLYLQGMGVTEVGRELSKNPGTIAQQRDRALEKMARCAARQGVEAR